MTISKDELKWTVNYQAARIAELKSALKPFADLSTYWEGDKLPLQPKLILIEPLPVLYATKALKDEDREG
jgi:hypothetical protein